ncbi:MAG: C40 family peptidase [Chloroflexi bacterium]|nr:C40 family peptidase [Chloroflexota bacterium]
MNRILEEYAKTIDPRTSLFDVQILSEANETLTLGGRLLDRAQLDDLSRLFPDRKLDTASIRILNAETHPRAYVATNLTGLYERPTFGMPLSSELYYGTELEILDENGNWVFTRQSDGYLGWAYRRYLNEGTAPAATHLVLAPSIEMRESPDQASGVVTRLVSGTGVGVVEKRGDWALVEANRAGWVPSSSLRPLADIPKEIEGKRKLMAADALRMIGVPYLWGGTSGNGIDCSGFARLLHRWVGATIPRDADMQHTASKPVEPPYETGDLFFFGEGDSERRITHVGVSLGGWTMIHSSRGNNGVYVDELQERKSLMDIFVSAGSFLR